MGSKSFYDVPALYDAIHLPDTPTEAAGILRVIGGARRLLEPACGTGRLLDFFARLGRTVTGYDVSAPALAFARRRLRGLPATVVKASMTSFRAPAGSFDAAYSLIGTFRHLLTERDALAHLRGTARALVPGGVYVVGFDLVDYDDCLPDEEGWEVVRDGRRLKHLYMTLPPDRKRRRERVINFVTAGGKVLQDEYDLRSYDLAQWRALVAKSPFRLAGVYDADGRRLRPSRATRYALFALSAAKAKGR